MVGKVNSVVEREWVALQINELLVVEYYHESLVKLVVICHWSFVIC